MSRHLAQLGRPLDRWRFHTCQAPGLQTWRVQTWQVCCTPKLSFPDVSTCVCAKLITNVNTCFDFRTKIFIRFPKTLFATEDALEVRKHSLGRNYVFIYTENTEFWLYYTSYTYCIWYWCTVMSKNYLINLSLTATKLQANWKGYSQKSKYRKMRRSGTVWLKRRGSYATFLVFHKDTIVSFWMCM